MRFHNYLATRFAALARTSARATCAGVEMDFRLLDIYRLPLFRCVQGDNDRQDL